MDKSLYLPRLFSLMIRAYQSVSFLFGARCRFYPSCSEYMRLSLLRYGVFKGLRKGCSQLIRCHPWYSGEMEL